MIDFLRKAHRFFSSQLFYPILLSSVLAMSFYLGRIVISGTWLVYRNLVWNLFLAWVPYAFSILVAAFYRLAPRAWWLQIIPGAVWLAFFPNAPYIVTDFLHLEQRPYVPLWYDIGLLASFAWTGLFLAIASLRTMQRLVKLYLGGIVSWLFAGLALSLGGLGLYLGRFSRWNSWDLVFQPKGILKDVALRFLNPLSNMRFFGFTLMFTALLLVCYLMFIAVNRVPEIDQLDQPQGGKRV